MFKKATLPRIAFLLTNFNAYFQINKYAQHELTVMIVRMDFNR